MSGNTADNQDKIIKFLENHHVGVLATADNKAAPHAATIYFVVDDDLNFFFVTKEKTQKHKNLQENPHVALAVYEAKSQSTVQVQGKAEFIKDVNKFMEIFKKLLKINSATSDSDRPPVSKLFAGDYFMYRLHPDKVRLAEYMKQDQGDFDNLFEVVKP